jgi:FemAB-related protein (PEP-CTERM system-associated)
MKIIVAETEQDAQRWQQFVEAQPTASNYHRWGWKTIIEKSFRWPTYYLLAEDQGRVAGILPLVWQKSRLFGSFLTSLPFLNAGGIVAESQEAEKALLAEAIELTKRFRARYLELRHRRYHELDLPTKTNKVTVTRSIYRNPEALWNSFPNKVRTDLRKAEQYGQTAELGGAEFLEEFYEVFVDNMRELGTPVYGRRFFEEILRTFPADSYLCVVRHEGKPIAASFLSGYRDSVESIWGCSLYSHAEMKPTMFMYWKAMGFMGAKGYKVFDFGRSTVGAGTHQFKLKWGSKEIPLYWVYWLPGGNELPELNPDNPRYQLAIRAWQKLPLAVTRWIGPHIVRCLP